MKAQDIMTKNPRTVTPETRLMEAARLMKDEDVGIIPVVESGASRRLVGVLTDRDITVRHVAEGHDSNQCPVREAMSDRLVTARPDEDIEDVMETMGREQIRRIPIVDERGDLVGILAQADLAREAHDEDKVEETVEKISKPGGRHRQ
ncbi:MAG TPA: CBS domain-containing protein [Gemmatimonadaceae bacterium]